MANTAILNPPPPSNVRLFLQVLTFYVSANFFHNLSSFDNTFSRNISQLYCIQLNYEGWNFNSGNYEYLFTTDTK